MRIGVDLVEIKRLERLTADGILLEEVFSPEEMQGSNQTLAGRLAAKEAYFKAVGEKRPWHSVEVAKKESGAPFLRCPEEGAQVSISHDGAYAIAVVVIPDL